MSVERVAKTLRLLERGDVDNIANTPLRHALNALCVVGAVLAENFDEDRYWENDGYAERWDRWFTGLVDTADDVLRDYRGSKDARRR